jgi:YD repeat-containing protein
VAGARVRKIQIEESEGFKELTYDLGGNLTTITLYTDDTKTLTLLTKTLAYDLDGNLETVTLTYSNGAVVVKTLAYTDGNLDSVES